MSNLVSPYVNTEFHTRISLLPHQMNNEIYIHLKNNLKKKIEKLEKVLELQQKTIDHDKKFMI